MPTPPIPSTRTVYIIQYSVGSSWITFPYEYPALESAKEWVAEWKQEHGGKVRYVKREITDTVMEEE